MITSDDRLPFPVFKPMITGDLSVMLVRFAVALLPVVELARMDPKPFHHQALTDLASLNPIPDIVDDFVANIVRNPASV